MSMCVWWIDMTETDVEGHVNDTLLKHGPAKRESTDYVKRQGVSQKDTRTTVCLILGNSNVSDQKRCTIATVNVLVRRKWVCLWYFYDIALCLDCIPDLLTICMTCLIKFASLTCQSETIERSSQVILVWEKINTDFTSTI